MKKLLLVLLFFAGTKCFAQTFPLSDFTEITPPPIKQKNGCKWIISRMGLMFP